MLSTAPDTAGKLRSRVLLQLLPDRLVALDARVRHVAEPAAVAVRAAADAGELLLALVHARERTGRRAADVFF